MIHLHDVSFVKEVFVPISITFFYSCYMFYRFHDIIFPLLVDFESELYSYIHNKNR